MDERSGGGESDELNGAGAVSHSCMCDCLLSLLSGSEWVNRLVRGR